MQERYKECPNPTCKAHLEHWEFFDNEEFCSVCGERLRTVGQPGPVPTNTMAAMAAAEERPYIDSYMEVRNTNNTWPMVLVAIAALVILALIAWLVFSANKNNTNNNVATTGNVEAVAATQTAQAQGTATAKSILSTAIATTSANNPNLPPAAETPSTNNGSFPTATPAAVGVVEATPIPLAQGGAYLIHNIGMVASCHNSAAKPTYKPNESFYVMVQADFGHSGVYEIHPVWQAPPGYSNVFNAVGDGMSIGNTSPSLNLRDGGMYYVCFEASPPAPQNLWNVGNYRVNIYINNDNLPIASRDFAVVGP